MKNLYLSIKKKKIFYIKFMIKNKFTTSYFVHLIIFLYTKKYMIHPINYFYLKNNEKLEIENFEELLKLFFKLNTNLKN